MADARFLRLFRLHDECYQVLASIVDVEVDGLTTAARFAQRAGRLDNSDYKTMMRLDCAYHVCRHLTDMKVKGTLARLHARIAHATSPCLTSPSSCSPSSPAPYPTSSLASIDTAASSSSPTPPLSQGAVAPCRPSLSRDLVAEQTTAFFDLHDDPEQREMSAQTEITLANTVIFTKEVADQATSIDTEATSDMPTKSPLLLANPARRLRSCLPLPFCPQKASSWLAQFNKNKKLIKTVDSDLAVHVVEHLNLLQQKAALGGCAAQFIRRDGQACLLSA